MCLKYSATHAHCPIRQHSDRAGRPPRSNLRTRQHLSALICRFRGSIRDRRPPPALTLSPLSPDPDTTVAMASVTSLDKDLRQMRLDKYTPAAANEARKWIEDTLGERLPSSDLLEGLKDGVALCK